MKLKVVYTYEIDVTADMYPAGVNTPAEVCEFEQNNEGLRGLLADMICNGEGCISVSVEEDRQ